MIWTASARAHRLGRGEVRYIYYGILAIYALWGLVILWYLPAFQIAKIGAVLGNLALGFSTLQALYVNRVLMPPEPATQGCCCRSARRVAAFSFWRSAWLCYDSGT